MTVREDRRTTGRFDPLGQQERPAAVLWVRAHRARKPQALERASKLVVQIRAQRAAVDEWFETEAERPASVAPDDWLRWEQEKHQALIAAATK